MGATILGYIPYMERIEKGGERGHIMIDRPESRERGRKGNCDLIFEMAKLFPAFRSPSFCKRIEASNKRCNNSCFYFLCSFVEDTLLFRVPPASQLSALRSFPFREPSRPSALLTIRLPSLFPSET